MWQAMKSADKKGGNGEKWSVLYQSESRNEHKERGLKVPSTNSSIMPESLILASNQLLMRLTTMQVPGKPRFTGAGNERRVSGGRTNEETQSWKPNMDVIPFYSI